MCFFFGEAAAEASVAGSPTRDASDVSRSASAPASASGSLVCLVKKAV